MANYDRDTGQAGFEQSDGSGDPQTCAKPIEPLLPEIGRAADAGAAQTLRGAPACQNAQVEEQDSGDPERDEPRQKIRRAAQSWAAVQWNPAESYGSLTSR